ncbi:hypothetical protein QBC45DRAFT_478779 [Copromyces sp. CBS 386.78]|nr:hypothetical protein QBC45DRAFT_478779 [Copromyces sp. CBS 386.78]
MADRRPGPNFKPAAPSRTAPPLHTGLSSAGAGVGAGAGARAGASVRRNLFQQPQSQSQPAQPTRQPTAAPDSQQSQGQHYSQQSSQFQSSQTYHQSNFQSHSQHLQTQYQQQASYLTQPYSQSYSYSYPYPQDSLPHLQLYHQLPQNHAEEDDAKMTSSSQEQQQQQQQQLAATDPDLEIVVRDKETGEIDLGNDPPTPPYDEDTEAIMEARMEADKERARLADAVREWLTEHEAEGRGDVGSEGVTGGGGGGGRAECGMDTEELLEAIKASLKAKVAALSEDNWMFEREEVLHLH